MNPQLLVFEGLDGTGKTTTASKLIQLSTAELPIHYIYFSKLESERITYDYFYDLSYTFKYLKGVIILDRSIISTYAYGFDIADRLQFFQFVLDYDPIIIYFDKVYDRSKLPPDYQRVKDRYNKALDLLIEWYKIPVLITDAQTFVKAVNSLEKLQRLLKEKRIPY